MILRLVLLRALALIAAFGILGSWHGLSTAQSFPGAGAMVPNPEASEPAGSVSGPVRLRQPTTERAVAADGGRATDVTPAVAYVPGEFERYVQQLAGIDASIRRFGSELVSGAGDARSAELSPLVPADYVIGPGDEVLVTLWGSVEADLRLTVDRSGRISIPRVGTIQVSGVQNSDLAEVVNRRVATVFKNFQSSVSLGQLRGIRVFVTGFVLRPGGYTVSSLSTLVGALMRAGGPSSAGSFRTIELRRGNQGIVSFDLYDLLLKGDRSADRVLQAGDVIHVGPVGTQVGVIGSVNKPAVVELKAGDTVIDVLRMAGGFTAVADRTRLAVERLAERNAGRVAQIELPRDERSPLSHGDVIRAFSAVSAVLSIQRQAKRVRVDGEVMRPGEYVLPETSSVNDAIRAAGGFTSSAYVYATQFSRVSVQRRQQENYERALRDLETELAKAASTQRISSNDEAQSVNARAAANSQLLERLRALRPSGRIVLQLEPSATELPDLALEDGDQIEIPSRPTTVGVFGSVFNAATYIHMPQRSLEDYLRLAGGPTKGADVRSIFVVRANGNVISARQMASWLGASSSFARLAAEPGDAVFVPEEMDKTTFLQAAKDWTQVIFQFGIGAAGIKNAFR